MKTVCSRRWWGMVLSGAVLLQFGACLGPNPGFFVSTSAANAVIGRLVNTLLSSVLGVSGG